MFIDKILPPIIKSFCVYLRHRILVFGYGSLIKKHKSTHNKYSDEEVYIIANGPSLRNFDFSKLDNKYVIVMNNFFDGNINLNSRIIAHCIGEPKGVDSYSLTEFLKAISSTNADSIWLHFSTHKEIINNVERDIDIYGINPVVPALLYSKKMIDLSKRTLVYQTTAQMAIMVAMHYGFKKINLLGYDHDWLATPDYSRHFYSDKKDKNDTMGALSYYELLMRIIKVWEIYYKIESICKTHSIEITNLNQNSFLDVFQKTNK